MSASVVERCRMAPLPAAHAATSPSAASTVSAAPLAPASERCDCGPQLREAAERIAKVGGYLLYLRQEGRGIGLYAKLDAYALQDQGLDTYAANRALGHGDDERDYSAAAQMLHTLGADRIRLLSNNPDKALQLDALGVEITEQLPTAVHLSAANLRYLQAKVAHTRHSINLPA
jgi:GTP cyclohydrolase II